MNCKKPQSRLESPNNCCSHSWCILWDILGSTAWLSLKAVPVEEASCRTLARLACAWLCGMARRERSGRCRRLWQLLRAPRAFAGRRARDLGGARHHAARRLPGPRRRVVLHLWSASHREPCICMRLCPRRPRHLAHHQRPGKSSAAPVRVCRSARGPPIRRCTLGHIDRPNLSVSLHQTSPTCLSCGDKPRPGMPDRSIEPWHSAAAERGTVCHY
jgi:hypothetical protein